MPDQYLMAMHFQVPCIQVGLEVATATKLRVTCMSLGGSEVVPQFHVRRDANCADFLKTLSKKLGASKSKHSWTEAF